MKNILIALVILLAVSVTGWCGTGIYTSSRDPNQTLMVDTPPAATIWTWKDCAGYSKGIDKAVECKTLFQGTQYLYKGALLTSDQLDEMAKAEYDKTQIKIKQYDQAQKGQVIFSVFIGIGIVIALWCCRKVNIIALLNNYAASAPANDKDFLSKITDISGKDTVASEQKTEETFRGFRASSVSDNVGKIIALYEEDEYEIRLKSNVGKFLGKYIKRDNATYDPVGKLLTFGNTLSMLIPRE